MGLTPGEAQAEIWTEQHHKKADKLLREVGNTQSDWNADHSLIHLLHDIRFDTHIGKVVRNNNTHYMSEQIELVMNQFLRWQDTMEFPEIAKQYGYVADEWKRLMEDVEVYAVERDEYNNLIGFVFGPKRQTHEEEESIPKLQTGKLEKLRDMFPDSVEEADRLHRIEKEIFELAEKAGWVKSILLFPPVPETSFQYIAHDSNNAMNALAFLMKRHQY